MEDLEKNLNDACIEFFNLHEVDFLYAIDEYEKVRDVTEIRKDFTNLRNCIIAVTWSIMKRRDET